MTLLRNCAAILCTQLKTTNNIYLLEKDCQAVAGNSNMTQIFTFQPLLSAAIILTTQNILVLCGKVFSQGESRLKKSA